VETVVAMRHHLARDRARRRPESGPCV